jgi:hypothetical protein
VRWRRDGKYQVGTFVHDVRGKTCLICAHGWELTGESFGDQIRWDLVDGHVHESCLVRHSGLIERGMFFDALCDARVRFAGLEPIANGYWPASDPWSHKPWYRAELLDHPAAFVLGRRKRVGHVAVVPTGSGELGWWLEAEARFADDDVTKEFSPKQVMVHAWSNDKVREYIARLAALGGYQVKR